MKLYKNLNLDTNFRYPIVCSFFTDNWQYPKWATSLKKDCERLRLNYYIEEYEDKKNYLKNCRIKPFHMYKVLEETNKPILWIDVDGSLLKKPDLFVNSSYDFMAKKMPETKKREWHVGTIFVNNTDLGKEFLKAWMEIADENGGTDEAALELLWKKSDIKDYMRYSDIPQEYFRIKNNRYSPNKKDIIIHRISTGEEKLKMKKKNKKA